MQGELMDTITLTNEIITPDRYTRDLSHLLFRSTGKSFILNDYLIMVL